MRARCSLDQIKIATTNAYVIEKMKRRIEKFDVSSYTFFADYMNTHIVFVVVAFGFRFAQRNGKLVGDAKSIKTKLRDRQLQFADICLHHMIVYDMIYGYTSKFKYFLANGIEMFRLNTLKLHTRASSSVSYVVCKGICHVNCCMLCIFWILHAPPPPPLSPFSLLPTPSR